MYTLLCFRVRAVTQMNQTVKICGNIPELGNWNPKYALTLTTNDNLYPMWINNNYLILQSEEKQVQLEFKCLIISGENQVWENTPNRVMTLECIKVIVFCTFGLADVSIVPLKKYSNGSLKLNQDELTKVRKVQLGGFIDPFESDINSSSDPDSDFQSLLRSREVSVERPETFVEISNEFKDYDYIEITKTSQQEIEIPKSELISITAYSSSNDLNKRQTIINWEECIMKYLAEELESNCSSKNLSRKSSAFSDCGNKEQSFLNNSAFFEHFQLTQLFRQESIHKLIIISLSIRKQKQKSQHCIQGDQETSPGIHRSEGMRNQLVKIVKKMSQDPQNSILIVGSEDPYELDNIFDKSQSIYLIPKRGRYVRHVNKNTEVQDLKVLGQQEWDQLVESIRIQQENYDYINFVYTPDNVTIDCSIIHNEQIKQCVMQEIYSLIITEIVQDRWIQVDKNQNEIIVQRLQKNLLVIIKTIISHEIQIKGPIQLQLQIVYNSTHDDELFDTMSEIRQERHLKKKRAFSSRLKNIYLIPISKESKFTNVRCNSQFEMVRLLDKMTSEGAIDKMVEDEQELMYS